MDGKKWTEQDRLLTVALTAHEESLCSGCGQPRDVAYDPDAEGWYEANEVVCAGCKAQADHAHSQKTPTAGGKLFVVHDKAGHERARRGSGAGSDDDPGDD